MGLLNRQASITPQRGMPTETRSGSSTIQAITGETVQFYYSNSGTRTIDAGQAAGVAVVGVLANRPVMNSSGTMQATNLDTSLTFTSTAFTTEVPFQENLEGNDCTTWATRLSAVTAGFSNGQYCVDYAHGIVYGVKASTQVSLTSAAYSVLQETTDVSFSTGATVATTPLTSETSTNVAVSASNFTVLASNTARRAATIANDGAANVYVKFGATATASSYKVKLGSGDYYEFPLPIYTGIVDAIGDSATGTLRVTEGI